MSYPRSRQKLFSLPRFRPGIVSWLLGVYCRGQSNSGFILPTATLLVVVAFLIMISLLARTANRVAQVSGQRERVAVEGPSGESVDRARAKIEYMFTREPLPTDPSEQNFEDFIGNRERDPVTGAVIGARLAVDLYTLPDETRCGLQDGDCETVASQPFTPGDVAPTWSYRVDLNGNGSVNDPEDGVAVYGIVGRVFRNDNSAVPVFEADGVTPRADITYLQDRRERANNFIVNNGPTQAQAADAFCAGSTGTVSEQGRFSTGSSAEQLKNFQIYAVTLPNKIGGAQLTSNSVVFQQDRRFTGANKWGAYFRNDLEIFPGPQFNWNGAVHTEGTLFITSGTGFGSYLISAPNSCYFLPPSNSEISARGLFMTGSNRNNNTAPGGNSFVHLQPDSRIAPEQIMQLAAGGAHTNPVGPGTFTSPDAVANNFLPVDLSMDPLFLITNNLPVARRREGGSLDYNTYKDNNWGGGLASRIQVDKCEAPPYVDDTFRADNRLGPKPSYARGSCSGAETWETLGVAGDEITGIPEWTRTDAPLDKPNEYGLDGYWERRALGQGMKVIVGQRLELGNVGVWGGWRQFGNRTTWENDFWETWTSTANPAEARIYNPTTNAYFSGATSQYSREIFGLLFRPNPTIAGIDSPGALDPLYPPAVLATEFGGTSPYAGVTFAPVATRVSEQLHRRTQRDNLAAVQATAVYHHRATEPSLPMLCLSNTIHPGTEASYLNSITFGDPVSPADPGAIGGVTRYPSLNANYVRPAGSQALFPAADFFTGRGTANMEYGTGADGTDAPFEEADFATGTVWRKALLNLAQFAGDPDGAYPPRQAPPGDDQVYPDPVLTMWGNFSNLRRTLATLDAGTDYADLSPADQANLHTAGCTIGLLATNAHHYLAFPFRLSGSGTTPHDPDPNLLPNTDGGSSPNIEIDLQRLGSALRQLQDGDDTNFEIGEGILSIIPLNATGPARNRYNIPAEYYIAALARIRDAETFSTVDNSPYQQWNRLVYLARMVNTRLQIVRDRTYGFREYVPGSEVGVPVDFNNRLQYRIKTSDTGLGANEPYALNDVIDLPCDLSLADIGYFGYTATPPDDAPGRLIEREMVALARLCPTQPKYPSLFYLFPGDLDSSGDITGPDAHGHDGDSGVNMRNSSDPSPYNQPSGSAANGAEDFSEPYVLSRYIAEEANSLATYEAFTLNDLNEMVFTNRIDPETDWQLPAVNLLNNRPVTDAALYQRETDLLISASQADNAHTNLTAYRTGLAEKAIYNGRQLQMGRVMDFDLGLLRDVALAPFGDDAWLSVGEIATAATPRVSGGVIYAFREDAVREDAILRPANTDWSAYESSWQTDFADGPPLALRMNPDPRTPLDPPVTPINISGKPVDYYADPERRDHGFRLVNGNDISRLNAPAERNIFGLSFVSDNSVYIMTELARGVSGFNLHANAGGTAIQEFTALLAFPYTFNPFYNRPNRNLAFADPALDTWRPAEILADGITLITHNFCDGYQEHGIRNVTNIDGQFGNECATGGPSARNTPLISSTGLGGTLNNPQNPPRNRWARENPYDEGAPIILLSDGTHRTQTAGAQAIVPVNNYNAVTTRGAVPGRGTNYTVNAVIVSGLVPSRRLQSYGGLHNFPRFIETGNALNIQGSLIQLAFSNYGTAPFDFDSFERGLVGANPENIGYYGPPQRFWGYDPGLQYAPAGPVSERFISPSNARNEYFLELTADDPYTCQMKRFVVPGLTCP
ncbi:hypothetical protein GlitD10_2535 [Gloeomargarita lithophora Alchichica-D10]|uniref:Uncharacterized protein n=1 Tax=Gloeomargarita lithophora Alchichica-D10 TaxID=1188229 RepID=A0A1J0AG11_9CYAN|nr:hypothetical protein [Gloeomargarita lithophora]APB34873.1 hypothetical protein GlitD10_2535 [Gloeomargarita lithophora Alchichica-D10]